jgi:hypothetical protein
MMRLSLIQAAKSLEMNQLLPKTLRPLDQDANFAATLEALTELALDLRNCWEHTTGPIWSKIDPELWALTHNPWLLLQTASRTKLEAVQATPSFAGKFMNSHIAGASDCSIRFGSSARTRARRSRAWPFSAWNSV